jgi:hypothetical protein
MKAERLADDGRQHCHSILKQTSDKQKVVIKNAEANITKQGKQISIPLETTMATM